MDRFIPVRHSGNSNTPVQDGQMLVDKSTGLVSWDIGGTRIQPTNVYGITRSVSSNLWVQSGTRYYINIKDLAVVIPYGFGIVGAQIVGSSAPLKIESGKIYSNERASGTILISSMPIATDITRSIVSLFHMEETEGDLLDSAGDANIPEGNTWTHATEARFGSGGSQLFSSLGSMDIHDLPSLDEFTIEWWQKDLQTAGDGGVIIRGGNGNYISISPISNSSTDWRHVAVVRDPDSTVRIYINGTLVETSNFEGTIDEPVTFYGLQGSSSGKVRYIDELAIFNYARYHDNFTPETEPYTGGKEPSTDYIYYGYISDTTVSSVTDINKNHLTQLKKYTAVEGDISIHDIPSGALTVIAIPSTVSMTAYKKNCCNHTDEFVTTTGSELTGANGEYITIDGISYRVYGELNLIKTTTVVVIKTITEYIQDVAYVSGALYTPKNDSEYTEESATNLPSPEALTVSGSHVDGVYVYNDLTGVWSN